MTKKSLNMGFFVGLEGKYGTKREQATH